jgi:hypothetical protein
MMKSFSFLIPMPVICLSLLALLVVVPATAIADQIIADNAYEVFGNAGVGTGANDGIGDMGVGDTTDEANRGRRGVARFSLAGLSGLTLQSATLNLTVIQSRRNDTGSGAVPCTDPIIDSSAPFTNPGLGDTSVVHTADPETPDASDYHAASLGNDPGVLIGSGVEPAALVSIDVKAAMQERLDSSAPFIGFRIETATEWDGDDCNDVWFIATEEGYLGEGTEPYIDYSIETALEVAIDIKPGSDPNAINTKKCNDGVIPVALLSFFSDCNEARSEAGCDDQACEDTVCGIDPFCCDVAWDGICVAEAADFCDLLDNFDATNADVTSLGFGPFAAYPAHDLTDQLVYQDHLQDVNSDSLPDLVSHYRCGDTGIAAGDTEACLTGYTVAVPPDSDCLISKGTPGCDVQACEDTVCGIDPFCCDVVWDGICAGEAEDFCEITAAIFEGCDDIKTVGGNPN